MMSSPGCSSWIKSPCAPRQPTGKAYATNLQTRQMRGHFPNGRQIARALASDIKRSLRKRQGDGYQRVIAAIETVDGLRAWVGERASGLNLGARSGIGIGIGSLNGDKPLMRQPTRFWEYLPRIKRRGLNIRALLLSLPSIEAIALQGSNQLKAIPPQ